MLFEIKKIKQKNNLLNVYKNSFLKLTIKKRNYRRKKRKEKGKSSKIKWPQVWTSLFKFIFNSAMVDIKSDLETDILCLYTRPCPDGHTKLTY